MTASPKKTLARGERLGWAGAAGRRAAVRPRDAAWPSPDCALLAANQDKYETAAVHFHTHI